MTIPVRIAYGERYSDGSGFERRLDVDLHERRVHIETASGALSMDLADWRWLMKMALELRFEPWWAQREDGQ
jgi:hypothetical protein